MIEIVISPMPYQVHVGLAIWPKKNAQWFELGLKAHAHVRTTLISNESAESSTPLDLVVMDGDNPGPSFISHYSAYLKSFGHTHLIVLGRPGCPALMSMDWEPTRTLFITKPYLIEDVLKTILQRASELVAAAEAATITPPPPPLSTSRPEVITEARDMGATRAKTLGYLSTLKLADLIQMLCLSNWTGKIDIQDLTSMETGTVHIADGIVVDAHQGGTSAEPACYRMLSWGRCQFEFVEDEACASRTVHAHWQAILLEGARLYDEGMVQ
jgi:hypothetical protein